MKALITGSSGHLGEALARLLRGAGRDFAGLDITESPYTTHIGSVADPAAARAAMAGCETVFHCATLHKPHVATHSRQDFVDVNVSGTLTLLEEARAQGVGAFIFTSTTSVFGHAMQPPPGAPAVWIDEDVTPIAKNIYGVTKIAAENLCALAHRVDALNCLILRTSRFFPEEDDSRAMRAGYADDNAKMNELAYRRADIEDMARAHLAAEAHAREIGFGRYIISATPPFSRDDLADLRRDAPAVLRRYFDYRAAYDPRGWRMFPSIERVYDNARARRDLEWRPLHDFGAVLARLSAGGSLASDLARAIGKKGYHDQTFDGDGPYPVDGSAP